MIATATCQVCGTQFEYDSRASDTSFRIPAPTICHSCDVAEREAAERRRRQEALADRNVPARYASATFDTYVPQTPSQQRALEVMRDSAAEGVYLVGRAGVGKTHLAACAVLDGPRDSLFVATTELLEDIRAGLHGNGRGLYERAKRAPLLVLDDLGSEAVTDWVRDRIYSLLNTRWNAVRPLIVTTNVTAKDIAERIGDGAASRLAGLCRHRIEVQGPDARRYGVSR